jgi:Arc/MetJ family transcription regulator
MITYGEAYPEGGAMRRGLKRKNYYLDEAAIKEAQRVLRTRTETETVQKALELVANEARLARALKDLLDKGRGHVGDPAADE